MLTKLIGIDILNKISNAGILTLLGFCFPTFGFDIYIFPQLGGISTTNWGITVGGYFVL